MSEIGHKLSLKELYLDELVILRDQLKSYQAQLSPEKQEQYERLLADERFKGRQAMIRELRAYLKDYSDETKSELFFFKGHKKQEKSKKMKKGMDKKRRR